jgi:hypothetical protein
MNNGMLDISQRYSPIAYCQSICNAWLPRDIVSIPIAHAHESRSATGWIHFSLKTAIFWDAILLSAHRRVSTVFITRNEALYAYQDTCVHRRNPPLQLSIQCSPQRTSKRSSCEPHGATRQQAIAKTPAKWSDYQIPSVIVVFVVLVFKV